MRRSSHPGSRAARAVAALLLVAAVIGGISVSFLMELLVYPVVFYLWKGRQLRRLPAVAAN